MHGAGGIWKNSQCEGEAEALKTGVCRNKWQNITGLWWKYILNRVKKYEFAVKVHKIYIVLRA